MSAPSLRSLLLEHLHKQGDGKRVCMHCPQSGSQKTVFSAGSTANAWEFHLKGKHPAQWDLIQKQRASPSEESPSDVISLAHSEGTEPLKKKQRTQQPAAAASSSSSQSSMTSPSSSSSQSSMTSHFSVTRDRPALQQLASALIQGGVSYRFVESPAFRQFLEAVRCSSSLPMNISLSMKSEWMWREISYFNCRTSTAVVAYSIR
jgi:hypothetical protein